MVLRTWNDALLFLSEKECALEVTMKLPEGLCPKGLLGYSCKRMRRIIVILSMFSLSQKAVKPLQALLSTSGEGSSWFL